MDIFFPVRKNRKKPKQLISICKKINELFQGKDLRVENGEIWTCISTSHVSIRSVDSCNVLASGMKIQCMELRKETVKK